MGELAHPIAVLSYAAWQRRFGGTDDVIGKSIIVNGTAYTVVGVAPREFRGGIPIITPELWLPLMQLPQVEPGNGGALRERGENSMFVLARLAPGATMERAKARMKTLEAFEFERTASRLTEMQGRDWLDGWRERQRETESEGV